MIPLSRSALCLAVLLACSAGAVVCTRYLWDHATALGRDMLAAMGAMGCIGLAVLWRPGGGR